MGVKKLIRQALLLALPFAVVFGIVVLTDPYDRFNVDVLVPDGLKQRNLWHDGRTMTFSNVEWKLIAFRRAPMGHVLFGDSRLAHFDDAYLTEKSGDTWFNFGIPGGNLRTLADLFAAADSAAQLRDVVVQTSFRSMGRVPDGDIVHEAQLVADDALLHVTNRHVLEATALNLYSRFLPDRVTYDQLAPDHWRQVLAIDSGIATTFELDTARFATLRRIAARCKAEGARLRFVEYPTHPDIQHIYSQAGLDPVRAQYIAELQRIAPTTDLDAPGAFPVADSLWRDPLHLTTAAQRVVVDRVWGD